VLSRFWVVPSFDFRGSGRMFNFGLMLLGSHFFWTILTQADVFIAGRMLSPHELGLYAEALFLTMIVASKFVPPLNEVAFPAYARIQGDISVLSSAFLKAVRMILLVTTPLYFGLAVTAHPTVALLFGEKWLAMAPLVTIIAFAMPAYTLHILFAPAINAVGRPRINVYASAAGAAVMIAAFLTGAQWGPVGLAWAWVIAFPLVPLATFLMARRAIGVSASGLLRAVAPAVLASAAMAGLVHLLGEGFAGSPPWLVLPVQIAFGAASYLAILWVFCRDTLSELLALVLRRRAPQPSPA
jgi:O-antigen/teichoic acid export membrane protein